MTCIFQFFKYIVVIKDWLNTVTDLREQFLELRKIFQLHFPRDYPKNKSEFYSVAS